MLESRQRRLRFEPAALFSVIVAILGILQAWQYSTAGIGLDFYQFWVTGQELRTGSDPRVYTDEWRARVGERYYEIGHAPGAPPQMRAVSEKRRLLQTFSSPLLYTFFSFIGSGSYTSSFQFFAVIAIICGAASILVIARVLEYSVATSILVLGALLGWGRPFLSDVYVGNVNQLQLLMVAALLWVELRMTRGLYCDLLGGAMLALMALFKPNLSAVAMLLGVM